MEKSAKVIAVACYFKNKEITFEINQTSVIQCNVFVDHDLMDVINQIAKTNRLLWKKILRFFNVRKTRIIIQKKNHLNRKTEFTSLK